MYSSSWRFCNGSGDSRGFGSTYAGEAEAAVSPVCVETEAAGASAVLQELHV
jgi:hypothetical protein